MCGLVSTISKRVGGFWGTDLDIFEGMLVLDTLRGLDSTGIFCVDAARQVGFMKVASNPFHLFSTQEYPKFRQRAINSGRILVGHNRKATQGAINSKNAHPFHAGNIVMVHNGTLRGDHKKDYAPVDVDSHALTIAFDEKGAENVIPTINGAFALIWWDIEKNSLFAVRNDERPLEIVETDDNYYVLSESWMVTHLLAKERKKVLKVHSIEPGKLHEWKIGGALTVTDIKIKEQEVYSGVVYHTGRQHNLRSDNNASVSGGKSDSALGSTTSPTTTLTLVKSGEAQKEAPATNTPLPVEAANHVPCDEFIKGQTILVKIYEMKMNQNGQLYHCRGKVCQPNTPEIDVVSYMKVSDVPEGMVKEYVSKLVEAVVQKHTTSVCGRSLYVNKMTVAPLIEVHNNRIAEDEWNYVTAYCQCTACKSPIFDEEQQYTSVVRRPGNLYTVTCAQCVEDTLKGQDKYEFNQNRLAAVQTYQRIGDETPSGALDRIHAPGTATLQ